MDITAFRAAFPEFADTTKYTDAMITFRATMGEALLNEERWGDLLTYGLYLFVAHNLVFDAKDEASSAAGRAPGLTAGVITSKGVGGVSVGYDAGQTQFENAGNFNMTKYGRDFWQLLQIVGMGGQHAL